MGAFLLFAVLTIGFVYTSQDLESRYKQKKSTSWESYAHMAMWGFLFWGLGALFIGLIWLLLAGVSFLLTAVGSVFSKQFCLNWHVAFSDWTLVDTSVPLALTLIFGAVFAWAVAEGKASKTKDDPQARLKIIQKIAASDNIQLLLIESSRNYLSVMITLKSRKVYIGFIKQFAHEQAVPGDEDIVIIPLISGYRDKDDLRFHKSHDYAAIYEEQEIGPTSKPLSLDHFRVVIPREQIESVSLFDPQTFMSFEQQSKKAKDLVDESHSPDQD